MRKSKCCIIDCNNEIELIFRDGDHREYKLCTKHHSYNPSSKSDLMEIIGYSTPSYYIHFRSIEFAGV